LNQIRHLEGLTENALIPAERLQNLENASFVMAGLVPAIHVLLCSGAVKTWMPGTRPGMTSEKAKA